MTCDSKCVTLKQSPLEFYFLLCKQKPWYFLYYSVVKNGFNMWCWIFRFAQPKTCCNSCTCGNKWGNKQQDVVLILHVKHENPTADRGKNVLLLEADTSTNSLKHQLAYGGRGMLPFYIWQNKQMQTCDGL